MLGLWVAQAMGVRFWLGVVTDLKQRNVEYVLVVCCDGLSGFLQAVEVATRGRWCRRASCI
jgi:putative transposase